MQFKPLNTAFIAINEQKVDRPTKQIPSNSLANFSLRFCTHFWCFSALVCLSHMSVSLFFFACLCFSVVIRSAFYVSLNHRKLKTYQSRNRMMKFLQITLFYQPFEKHCKFRWIVVILSTVWGLNLRNFRLLKLLKSIFLFVFVNLFRPAQPLFVQCIEFVSNSLAYLLFSFIMLSMTLIKLNMQCIANEFGVYSIISRYLLNW